MTLQSHNLYNKQFNRSMLNFVQQNRALVVSNINATSLNDAAFALIFSKLLKSAMQLGLFMRAVNSKFQIKAEYSVLAMTTDEFIDALKYFTVLSYTLEFKRTPNLPANVVKEWQNAALTVFSPFKVNLTRSLSKLTNILAKPNYKLSDAQYETVFDTTTDIRNAIYPKKGKIFADPVATANLRNYLAKIFTYFNSKTESPFKAITQNVRFLNDPKLSSVMHVSQVQISNAPINAYLKWIAKKTTRKNPQFLLTPEVEALSDKDKETHKKLRLEHNKAYKDKLQDIVRNSDAATLPAVAVKKALHSEGFPHWAIPEGFKGNVDEKGALYTHTGLPLDKGQAGGVMEMNPEWSPKNSSAYYAKGRSNFATTPNWQYFQTLEHTKNTRNEEKQKYANELEEKLPKLQVKWRKHLRSGSESEKLLGGVLEALYQTQARIGSENNPNGTFGLTTWLNKHVKINAAGNAVITYLAKSNMQQRHIIKPDTPEKKALVSYIIWLKEGKEPNEPLWSTENYKVTSNNVRNYLKSLGFEGHPHNFRHASGNRLWDQLIAEKPLNKKNPTPKEVADYHKAITLKVGQLLGHQRTNTKTGQLEAVGSTAAKSYIDPSRQIRLFREKGVPVPPAIERIAKDEE